MTAAEIMTEIVMAQALINGVAVSSELSGKPSAVLPIEAIEWTSKSLTIADAVGTLAQEAEISDGGLAGMRLTFDVLTLLLWQSNLPDKDKATLAKWMAGLRSILNDEETRRTHPALKVSKSTKGGRKPDGGRRRDFKGLCVITAEALEASGHSAPHEAVAAAAVAPFARLFQVESRGLLSSTTIQNWRDDWFNPLRKARRSTTGVERAGARLTSAERNYLALVEAAKRNGSLPVLCDELLRCIREFV
jgi:hypothetical protein